MFFFWGKKEEKYYINLNVATKDQYTECKDILRKKTNVYEIKKHEHGVPSDKSYMVATFFLVIIS